VQEDLDRLRVGGEDDEFCDTAVQGLRSCRKKVRIYIKPAMGESQLVRTLVSTLFELLVLCSLIDQLQNLVRGG
jgi:hypothetical protein